MTDTETKPETMTERLKRLEPIVEEIHSLPPDERRRRMMQLDLEDLEFLAAMSTLARYVRKGS